MHTGHVELYVVDAEAGTRASCEPYDGKLVVTAHTCREQDPDFGDRIAHALDAFMREHNLSRLEAYWNAVPED